MSDAVETFFIISDEEFTEYMPTDRITGPEYWQHTLSTVKSQNQFDKMSTEDQFFHKCMWLNLKKYGPPLENLK